MLTRHIQNPATRHIQPYSGISRAMCNSCICKNLAYSKSWNIQNPLQLNLDTYSEPCHIYENLQIFRTLTYLKLDTDSEPSKRFNMEFSAIFRTLPQPEFWHIQDPRHIQNPVCLGKIRQIQTYSIMTVTITFAFFSSLQSFILFHKILKNIYFLTTMTPI